MGGGQGSAEHHLRSLQVKFSILVVALLVLACGSLAGIATQHERRALESEIEKRARALAMNLAGAAKVAVTEYFQDRGTLPTSNTEAGLGASNTIIGKYVDGVSVGGSGVVTVGYGNSAHATLASGSLTMTPTDNSGSVSWVCAGTGIDDKHLPAACRSVAT